MRGVERGRLGASGAPRGLYVAAGGVCAWYRGCGRKHDSLLLAEVCVQGVFACGASPWLRRPLPSAWGRSMPPRPAGGGGSGDDVCKRRARAARCAGQAARACRPFPVSTWAGRSPSKAAHLGKDDFRRVLLEGGGGLGVLGLQGLQHPGRRHPVPKASASAAGGGRRGQGSRAGRPVPRSAKPRLGMREASPCSVHTTGHRTPPAGDREGSIRAGDPPCQAKPRQRCAKACDPSQTSAKRAHKCKLGAAELLLEVLVGEHHHVRFIDIILRPGGDAGAQ